MLSLIRKKISLSLETVSLLFSSIIVLFYNCPFWHKFIEAQPQVSFHTSLVVVLLIVALIALMNFLSSLLFYKRVYKLVAIVFLTISGLNLYFISTYNILIDSSMMENVLETNKSEALDLVTPGLFLHALISVILPAILISRIQLKPITVLKQIKRKVYVLLVSLLVAGVAVFFCYKDYASTFRNNRHLVFLLNPINTVSGTAVYIHKHFKSQTKFEPIGLDAVQQRTDHTKKNVTVLIVGESARAQNFSLLGYARDTNPLLSKHKDLVVFSNVASCGTSTAASVPCMFSPYERADYARHKALSHENVLDVLKRAGIFVYWRNNNSGCKGMCERVQYEDMGGLSDPNFCTSEECYDEILLKNLEQVIASTNQDVLIVLHQKGSHGPAYFKRVPQRFKKFMPECLDTNLQACTQEEITNSYDNTILYTDYIISSTINLLKTLPYNSALLYMSDHGQSLGEKGLYLHGMPYFIAPKEQTHIPMLMWLSPSYIKSLQLKTSCLNSKHNEEFSHDNLFHTLLGMNSVQTKEYKPELDITRSCR